MQTFASHHPNNSAQRRPVNLNHTTASRVKIATALTPSTAVQRKPSCACGGSCPQCESDRILQAKLKMGEPEDQYEQEADRVADQVMGMSESTIQRQEELEDEEDIIQRQSTETDIHAGANASVDQELDQKPNAADVPPVVHEVLNTSGQQLSAETRAFFEPRFGRDFSQVRVHTDAKAAESAQAINALAYTAGQNIVFGEGQYAPGANQGKRLLAHELTHVIQQSAGKSHTLAAKQNPASISSSIRTDHSKRIRRLTISPVGSLHTGTCGERRIDWRFTLDNAAPADGYFVQQVNIHDDIQACPSNVASSPASPTFQFWEAWNVNRGDTTENIGSPGFTDRSAAPGRSDMSGTSAAVGHVKFFLRSVTGDLGGFDTNPSDPASPWRPGRSGGVPRSGGLPSVASKPSWWDNAPTEGPVRRWASSWWNCCGDASSHFSRVDADPK